MTQMKFWNSKTETVGKTTKEKGRLAYSIGGMHSMLMKWAESGMTIPSTALIQQLKVGFQSPDL